MVTGLDFPGQGKNFRSREKIPKWENLGKLHIIHLNKIPWIWKAATVHKSTETERCLQIAWFQSQYQPAFAYWCDLKRLVSTNNRLQWTLMSDYHLTPLLCNVLWFNDPTQTSDRCYCQAV